MCVCVCLVCKHGPGDDVLMVQKKTKYKRRQGDDLTVRYLHCILAHGRRRQAAQSIAGRALAVRSIIF